MKKAIKEKWVKALKSGKYKKAKNALRTNKGYCCLGVLCDLYAKEKKQKWEARYKSLGYNFQGISGVLPDKVMKWAGLKSSNPFIDFDMKDGLGAMNTNLGEINDRTKTSFKKIAELIDKNL